MFNVSTLHKKSIKLFHQKLWSYNSISLKPYIKSQLELQREITLIELAPSLNQTPSCICSMCLHCIGKVSNCSIKSCSRSWSAHEGTIYAYTKALLMKNCLSSHSCHFVKNYFFWTKLLLVGRICNNFEKNRAFYDKSMKHGTWLVDNNTNKLRVSATPKISSNGRHLVFSKMAAFLNLFIIMSFLICKHNVFFS